MRTGTNIPQKGQVGVFFDPLGRNFCPKRVWHRSSVQHYTRQVNDRALIPFAEDVRSVVSDKLLDDRCGLAVVKVEG